MAIKGWRIIWIIICLFQPWANQVDIALGMRRTHHNRCAHVQSVPSPLWGCNTKALFSSPSPSSIPLPFSSHLSPSHHLSFLTFEMGIASSHQFTSLWSLLCLCCFQLHSSIKGETGKSWSRALSCQRAFWWRPVATSESLSVGAQGPHCLKHRLHADSPPIHQKLGGYFYKLKCTVSCLYWKPSASGGIYYTVASISSPPALLLLLHLLSSVSTLLCLWFKITLEIVTELLRCKILSVQHTPRHHLLCNSLTP